MTLTFDVIVLDMDDTLYLERDYVRSGFAAVGDAVAERFGTLGVGEELWELFLAGVRRDTFNRVLAGRGLAADATVVGELIAVYRSHRPQIALLPDADALLRVADAGRLGLITDGAVSSQRRKVEALGLEGRIRSIVVTAELGPDAGKPNRRSFELVAQQLSAQGRSCVYVGDNPAKDFIGPRALGWSTVRIRRPGSLHFDTDSGTDVEHEVESLEFVKLSSP